MGIYGFLKRKFGMGPPPTVDVTREHYSVGGEAAEIPMRDLLKYLKTDVQFRLAVMTYVAYSVGNGYHNTADESTPTGRKALELVNDFCEDWDLDSMNITTATEAWATGNSFDNFAGSAEKPFSAIYKIPLSTIQRINRDEFGKIISYQQSTSYGYKSHEPEEIGHFRFLVFDNRAWGEGLGQIMARPGLGYKTNSGRTVYRPSHFEINEFLQDASAKLLYYGLPRFLHTPSERGIITKEMRDETTKVLDNLDPGQHIVSPYPSDLKSVSLDTQNRFDSLIKIMTESRYSGLMTPIDRLWSLSSFNYASSKEAMKATLPLIDMYQRKHKRYIEQNIYAPLIMQDGRDVRKADVKLHWGEPEALEMDAIKSAWDILQDPSFVDKFNPEDFIDMLKDAGLRLSKPQMETAQIDSNMEALRKLTNSAKPGDKLKFARQTPEQRVAELKAKLFERLEGR